LEYVLKVVLFRHEKKGILKKPNFKIVTDIRE
jgi:hypothetical protein